MRKNSSVVTDTVNLLIARFKTRVRKGHVWMTPLEKKNKLVKLLAS